MLLKVVSDDGSDGGDVCDSVGDDTFGEKR